LVTQVPQVKNSKFKLTNAKVTGVAVSSFSKNLQTAVLTADLMANGEFARDLATLLAIAPARRDLLNQRPTDAYFPHFYTSALIARSWLDPSPTDSNNVFRRIIDGVLSNSMTPYEAIGDADSKLQLLLRK
jgi:maltose-binding protein MalE